MLQCLNINVTTLVAYATIETKFQYGKNSPKTPCQKLAKNPLKIPQAKIFYDFLNKKPLTSFKIIK